MTPLPRRTASALLVAFLALAAMSCAEVPAAGATEVRARVAWVTDGDTITVRIGDVKEKVRLIGIDTPEIHDVRAAWREAAERAKRYAVDRLGKRTVTLVGDAVNQDRDEHGRLLRYVVLDDGTDFNEEMIAKGHARAYLRFRFERKARYRDVQEKAKAEGLGVWKLPPGPSRIVGSP